MSGKKRPTRRRRTHEQLDLRLLSSGSHPTYRRVATGIIPDSETWFTQYNVTLSPGGRS